MKHHADVSANDRDQHFSGVNRFESIKKDLFASPMFLCTERARLITQYFKKFDDPKDPMLIRKDIFP